MESVRVAVVNPATMTVENVILAGPGFVVSGRMLIPSDEAAPGWGYDLATGAFIAPEELLSQRYVLSVLPVAFRRALRNTPAPTGDGHALAYVLAALSSPGYEDAKDAFEYMVRAERQDLVALGGALGFTTEQIDGVLDLAATYPGADAVYGPAP